MDTLEHFKQYHALVQRMREAQEMYYGNDLSGHAEFDAMIDLEKAVDTFPLPWTGQKETK